MKLTRTKNQQIVDFFTEEQLPTDLYVAEYYVLGERANDPLRHTQENKQQIMREIDPLIDKVFERKCKTDPKFCQKPSKNLRSQIKQAFFDNLETMASEPNESELHHMWRP